MKQYGTFVIADPRTFAGDPYEVAERAVAQAEALVTLLTRAVSDARVMARNAELERQTGDELDVSLFENGPHARKFDGISRELGTISANLVLLRAAVAFDPKRR